MGAAICTAWPQGQIDLAVTLWAEGESHDEIAAEISGHVTLDDGQRVAWPARTARAVSTLLSRRGYRGEHTGRRLDRAPQTVRTCITCRTSFFSWGKENRMCERCRVTGGESFDARWTYA